MKILGYKNILVATIFASCSLAGSAQIGGDTAYNYLNVSNSTRIYGLGGTNISLIDDDVLLTEQNPALLGPEMSKNLALSYMRYFAGSNFAALKYAHSAGENAAWSAGIDYFGYGSMTETMPDGSITGTFNASDVAFTGAYSHNLSERWRGGFNVKLLYSAYAGYSAMAVATDLGVNYFNEEQDASFSVVLSNLGGQVKKFNETTDKLPFDLRMGWSKGLGSSPLTLSITATNLTKWQLPYVDYGDGTSDPEVRSTFTSNLFRHLIFGVEWTPTEQFYVDFGYNYKQRTDLSTTERNTLSGFSIGLGFKAHAFRFGAALARPHVAGTTFMVNFTTNLYEF
jgi:hypothetical protein